MDYVRAVSALLEAMRQVEACKVYHEDPTTQQQAHEAAWGEYDLWRAPALMAGPSAASDSMKEFHSKLRNYSNALDAWVETNKKPRGYNELRDTCRNSFPEHVTGIRLSLEAAGL